MPGQPKKRDRSVLLAFARFCSVFLERGGRGKARMEDRGGRGKAMQGYWQGYLGFCKRMQGYARISKPMQGYLK